MVEDVAYQEVTSPVCESDFVGYIQSTAIPAVPCALLPGTLARTLNADAATGRAALLVDVPAGFVRLAAQLDRDASLDVVVLAGALELGRERLAERDFAFVPPGLPLQRLAAPQGARLLLFVDPPTADAAVSAAQRARGMLVTRYDERGWREASLVRAAGLELDLAVQMLKQDEVTTARTWYVRQGAGGKVPWERHSVVEEGFLVTGDYRLAERLPARTVIGNYVPGGYFRRPPGILHSGPLSGTASGAVWLQRSPAALDVTFAAD